MVSRVDQIYRSILLTKFFVRGWGKPENLRRIFAFRKIISNRETCQHLVDRNHPVTITKEVDGGDHLVWEGEFVSPFVDHMPGLLPVESEVARFQMVVPKLWRSHHKPTCLHLAGTGDHGFWRRKMLMAKPLLDEGGIASIMLENPFYGCRKPKDQVRSSLHNVSDLFVMGGCLVLESLAIFHWCERMGFGPLGITGISMGGHMASLAATNWHKPLPLVPCLSWSTASGVFTQGVLSGAINWEMLKNQYFSNEVFRKELFKMIHSPEDHFPVYHEVGQKFARDFPISLSHVEELMEAEEQSTSGQRSSGETRAAAGVTSKVTDQRNGNGEMNKSRGVDRLTSSQAETNETSTVAKASTGGQLERQNSSETNDETRGTATSKLAGAQIIRQSSSSSTEARGGGKASGASRNILQSFGLSKTRLSGARTAKATSNILTGYQKAKSSVSKPLKSELTPVGLGSGAREVQAGVSAGERAIGGVRKAREGSSSSRFEPYIEVKDALTWEALQFMRGIMDECTHLGNFSVPVDPSLAIIVAAKNDGYMPRNGIIPLTQLWPGSELRTLPTGHVAAYLFNHQVFRQAIRDSFHRLMDKYYTEARASEG